MKRKFEPEEIINIRLNPLNQNWTNISVNRELSEDFIEEFQDYVIWYYLSKNQKLSENFIRKFQDKLDWNYLCRNQEVSEDFVREFQHKVNWFDVSFKIISEDFIREFKDKLYWSIISLYYNKLSKEFIVEFVDKIDFDRLIANENISKDLKDYCRMFV